MIDNDGKYIGSSHYPCIECDSNNAEDCCDFIQTGDCGLLPPEEDEEGTSLDCHNWDLCNKCTLSYSFDSEYFKNQRLCPVICNYLKGRF